MRLNGHQELPDFASLPPDDEPDPLFELFEPSEPLELSELLAVGVDEGVVSVPVEPELELVELLDPEEPPELVVEDDVPTLPEPVLDFVAELLVCVACGTVAATANDPATPLAATIAVIVAVRALPCRTARAAPSASMAQLRQGKLSIRDPHSARAR